MIKYQDVYYLLGFHFQLNMDCSLQEPNHVYDKMTIQFY